MNVIYRITNLINGKKYIGKTKNLKDRWKSHMDNSNNTKIKYPLYLAIRKYGISNFKVEAIHSTKEYKRLSDLEKFYIKKEHSLISEKGYNLTVGGEGGDTFTNNPNKDKIREVHKKNGKSRWQNPKYRMNVSNGLDKANSKSDTSKNRSVAAFKKWENPEYRKSVKKSKQNLQYRKKVSDSVIRAHSKPEYLKLRSKQSSGKNNGNWKGYVYVYSDNIFKGRYNTIREASEKLKISGDKIRRNAYQNETIKRGPYKGYKFVINKNIL
jgi:group I intron endonuclease